jgi:NADH:ubiquinone oxidoreductase subunit F (NADH-binding)/Pyruvate/2-oxoacid:ferredoxin oxidoreductase delta subunit
LLNNVETFAMVPWIIRNKAGAFAALGTEKSKGTKVFALAGKIARAGLIEVPMGITIREIIEEIGGGVPDGKRFKAVQIGGPSGGCIPASLGHTTVDFEALTEVGAMMGSGGLIVLDEDDCMVDVARYFMSFLRNESCGQCTFCRIGTTRMWEILDKICNGKGTARDLDDLKQLATFTEQGSMCGLGKSAPNPVLSTLRYFLNEYEEHLKGRCPAGRCKPLIQYVVQDNCTGCTICAQHCPANAIPITPYQRHKIDVEKCTRCDVCRTDCPVEAIHIESGGQKTAGHLHKEPLAHISLVHQ